MHARFYTEFNVENVLIIQHQTCVDEIFKCTIFEGYGAMIFFTGVTLIVVVKRIHEISFVAV